MGTHAFGDRATALVLDAVRAVRDQLGTAPSELLIVIVDDDDPDAAAALRLGTYVAAQRGITLRVQGAGERVARRAAHAVAALRRSGVNAEHPSSTNLTMPPNRAHRARESARIIS